MLLRVHDPSIPLESVSVQADQDLRPLTGLADHALKYHAPEYGHHFHASPRRDVLYRVSGRLFDVGLEYKGGASRAAPACDQSWRDNRRIGLLRRSDSGRRHD